jgi:hypothetical protein
MPIALTSEPVMRVLLSTSNNLGQRVFHGEAAFAGGGRCAAHNNKYVPLDLPTLRAPFMLSEDGALPLRITAAAVRDHDALLRQLIEDVEDAGLSPLPAAEQTFFAVAVVDKGATLVEGGKPAALAQLSPGQTLSLSAPSRFRNSCARSTKTPPRRASRCPRASRCRGATRTTRSSSRASRNVAASPTNAGRRAKARKRGVRLAERRFASCRSGGGLV